MTRNKTLTLLAALALIALVVAGCGGGNSGTQGGNQGATLSVAKTDVGSVLVDSKGRTLYLFKKDSGAQSMCSGECANDWPPLPANGSATVDGGAKASLVGTTKRASGAAQLTYNGHPLYLYEGDQKAGDTNGQGVSAFGAAWYAVGAAGKQVSVQPSSSGGGSGGGYGY